MLADPWLAAAHLVLLVDGSSSDSCTFINTTSLVCMLLQYCDEWGYLMVGLAASVPCWVLPLVLPNKVCWLQGSCCGPSCHHDSSVMNSSCRITGAKLQCSCSGLVSAVQLSTVQQVQAC